MNDDSYPTEKSFVCPFRVRGNNTLCFEGKSFVPYSIPVKQACRAWDATETFCGLCE